MITASRGYAWYVVAVLVVAYIFSYVDRTILTLMVAPIRATLGISDIQISLLHGLAFALFYTILGIPIGRQVDRRNRVGIVTIGILLWSLMTALCGVARSFGALFASRVGVGVGEATLSPAAFSIIGDYFPPERLARALGVFTAAMYVGSGVAMIAGGALVSVVPPLTLPVVGPMAAWQVVFVIVGAPGLLVALLVAGLREPPRRATAGVEDASSFGDVLRHIGAHRGAYVNLILGLSMSSLVWNGLSAWVPTCFIRFHGWTAGQIGLAYGSELLVCGTSGVISGALLTEAMRGRGRSDAAIRVAMLSAAIVLPVGVAASLVADVRIALALFAMLVFVASLPYGCGAAALQEITPNRMRGQVSALYLFGINLAGIGLGPTIVALGARMLGGDRMLGEAMALVAGGGAALALLLLARAAAPYRAVTAGRDVP